MTEGTCFNVFTRFDFDTLQVLPTKIVQVYFTLSALETSLPMQRRLLHLILGTKAKYWYA